MAASGLLLMTFMDKNLSHLCLMGGFWTRLSVAEDCYGIALI
jgi:hypothetical protein